MPVQHGLKHPSLNIEIGTERSLCVLCAEGREQNNTNWERGENFEKIRFSSRFGHKDEEKEEKEVKDLKRMREKSEG